MLLSRIAALQSGCQTRGRQAAWVLAPQGPLQRMEPSAAVIEAHWRTQPVARPAWRVEPRPCLPGHCQTVVWCRRTAAGSPPNALVIVCSWLGQVAGYVERERYEVKLRHRQLGQLLCYRCQELSNGAMIPAVADFAQREGGAAPRAAGAQQGERGRAAPALAAAVAAQHAGAAMAPQGQAAPGDSKRARRHTGFTDKVLLTPEELRQKLK